MNSVVRHHVRLIRAMLECISVEDRDGVLAELAGHAGERAAPVVLKDARVDRREPLDMKAAKVFRTNRFCTCLDAGELTDKPPYVCAECRLPRLATENKAGEQK